MVGIGLMTPDSPYGQAESLRSPPKTLDVAFHPTRTLRQSRRTAAQHRRLDQPANPRLKST